MRELKNRDWNILLHRILREGNLCVDLLAKFGYDIEVEFQVLFFSSHWCFRCGVFGGVNS